MISKTVDPDGPGTAPATTEYSIYDGERAVLKLSSTGSVNERLVWADQVDMLMADETATNGLFFPLADYQGTTRDVVNASGTLVNHVNFDSLGNIKTQTSGAPVTTIVYAGLIWDGDANQYRSFTRMYDPATGRWTGEDKIEFGGDPSNIGRYVDNSPPNRTDRTGFWDDENSIGGPRPPKSKPPKFYGPPNLNGQMPGPPRKIGLPPDPNCGWALPKGPLPTMMVWPGDQGKILKIIESLDPDFPSDWQVMEAVRQIDELYGGDDSAALGAIQAMRDSGTENQLLACLDHYYNAKIVVETLPAPLRPFAVFGIFVINTGYTWCKAAGIRVHRDRENVPPSEPTVEQWMAWNCGAVQGMMPKRKKSP